MDNAVIPPPVSWYEPDIMACASDNTIIYGSQQDLVVIRATKSDKPDDIYIVPKAHYKRIVSVNVNTHWSLMKRYAVSASGEDRVVKLWDISTMEKKASHNKHYSNDQSKLIAAAFVGDDRVVSASDNGRIIIWNVIKLETIELDHLFGNNKSSLSCLSVCPHAPWIAAVGMKSGLISVIDLRRKGKLLYNMRGHGKEVLSLSWCPASINIFLTNSNNEKTSPDPKTSMDSDDLHKSGDVLETAASDKEGELKNPDSPIFRNDIIVLDISSNNSSDSANMSLEEDPDLNPIASNTKSEEPLKTVDERIGFVEELGEEYLLASSARESKIFIWRAGTDGGMQTQLNLPKPKTKLLKESNWIRLCWVAPNILLSSSIKAELLQWTLSKETMSSQNVKVLHNRHWACLLNIEASITYSGPQITSLKPHFKVWTVGLERTCLNFDSSSKEVVALYPSVGASINCMEGSPLDPYRLAYGTNDGEIKVWNLGTSTQKVFACTSLYDEIFSGVTALAWHPIGENLLAWGTTEGRIGLSDVGKRKKKPTILPHYFKSTIFKIEWGPNNFNSNEPKLFVAAENKVAIFYPSFIHKRPEVLELPEGALAYTMAWKPGYSKLIVSIKSDGYLEYDGFSLLQKQVYSSYRLDSIVWHPDAGHKDKELCHSKRSNLFASIVKSNQIFVFDNGKEVKSCDHQMVVSFKNKYKLNAIQWSPHNGNYLVSIDDGGIVQVYDIDASTKICTYLNPWLDPLKCVYWSPVDPDFVILGTERRRLVVFKVCDWKPLDDEEITTIRNRIHNHQQAETKDNVVKDKEQAVENDYVKIQKNKKLAPQPTLFNIKERTTVEDMQELLLWKLGRPGIDRSTRDSKQVALLDVFGDQMNLSKVFDVNCKPYILPNNRPFPYISATLYIIFYNLMSLITH